MYVITTDDISVARAVARNDNAWGSRRFWMWATLILPVLLCFLSWKAAVVAAVLLPIKLWFSHRALVKTREDLKRIGEGQQQES